MRRALLSVLFLTGAARALAQPYGNEWIHYGQQYWRFEIAAEGIYRIDSAALANAGFPVATVDPREIQLFNREQQVPIYVEGEADGVFNTGDFIEFRGRKNDGWKDLDMWDDPAHQNDPYYSLHNDTIRYFLTWNGVEQKLRIANYTNTAFGLYNPRPWFWSESLQLFVGGYQKGDRTNIEATDSYMVEGEGWFNASAIASTSGTASQTQSIYTPVPFLGSNAPQAKVDVVWAGVNNPGDGACRNHHFRLNAPNGGSFYPVLDTIFKGYQLNRYTFNVSGYTINGAGTAFRGDVIHDLYNPDSCLASDYPDRQSFAWIKVGYGRNNDMVGAPELHMWLPDEAGDPPIRVDLMNPGSQPLVYVLNGDTVRRVLPTLGSTAWQMLLPSDPTNDTTHAYVFGQAGIVNLTAITPVTPSGYFTDYSAVVADSAMLIVTHPALMNGALMYANYRESSLTNHYDCVVADVEELYDQYAGGIERHPLGIRRWCEQLLDTWPTRPRALFLIGKGVQAPRFNSSNQGYRAPADTTGRRLCRIPSFGYPPSDVCFTLGLDDTDPSLMAIPVGRLAAYSEAQVEAYRQKVEEYEGHTAPEEWMKNILHFRGGSTEAEWYQFGSALSAMEAIAEDTLFVGHVTNFVKNDAEVISMASADSVEMMIEQGVSLMTFFGHASGDGFDLNIDNVSNYDWGGRYPTVIGNSCYTGNIHLTTSTSSSEQFVLPGTQGAIAFLASVDIGVSGLLSSYSGEFYRSFSYLNYGGSIGQHMQHSIKVNLDASDDILNLNNVQTFTLHGDPTLRLYSFDRPDLTVDADDISFSPVPVTADLDSFAVKAVVTNIGKGTDAPFVVSLTRTLQDGTVLDPLFTSLQIHFQDTAVFHVPVNVAGGGLGQNLMRVQVDLDPDVIDEVEDVSNNQAEKPLLITSGDLVPAWPYEFAIIPDALPTLQASTVDPFAPVNTYVLQIDTTDTYDSPSMEQHIVTAPGGVVSWQPAILNLNSVEDSLVFFWRCSRDTVGFGPGNYNWFESSFQHITGRQGWGQAHFFQFKHNDFNQLEYDRPGRELDYFTGQHNIRCQVYNGTLGVDPNLTEWRIELDLQDYGGCGGTPALHVAVVDPTTLEAWGTPYGGENPDHYFGQVNYDGLNGCRSRIEKFFSFRESNAAQMDSLADMLLNDVPDGHYLLVYTWRYLDRAALNTNDPDNDVANALAALGSTDFASAPDSVPYIFFVRKGFPASAVDTVGNGFYSNVDVSVWVSALGNFGRMTWPKAGPAYEWNALYWNEAPSNPEDSTRIKVTGITPIGTEFFLHDRFSPEDSLTTWTSPQLAVDAEEYPWLTLGGWFYDDSALVPHPAQLERWQLLAAPAPECAIDPPTGFLQTIDGLFEGQTGQVAVAVRNIGTIDMDSLLISAWITDAASVQHRVHYRRNAPLPAGGVVLDTITVNTAGLTGLNHMRIEANPVDTTTGLYDQLEQYHFNNTAELHFTVQNDEENPVLDVTFDGVHILDNDIVSARPEIRITLDDENATLLFDELSDTTYFKVFLTTPDGTVQRIYFHADGLEQLEFVPTDGPENICHINYRPVFAQDGIYALRVQASDISFNRSGDEDYVVRFEVINRPTITNVLNYPNPFTTNTRFVFTITGVQPPTQMKIQIYTVSGRVVRTIDLAELGPLHIGRNITQYGWDGTDEFGDKLARGVYLYRVYAQLNGEEIEQRATAADGYFTKGFGKMYLLR